MLPVINERGERMLGFHEIDEGSPLLPEVGFALVLLRAVDGWLVVFNTLRQCWELPGGKVDAGETPRQCAQRELLEESMQTASQLRWRGLIELAQPCRTPEDNHCAPDIGFGALFCGELERMREFVPNVEVSAIGFWSKATPLQPLSSIDAALMNFFK